MNKLKQVPFRMLMTLLCLISMGAYGQTQTKTFKETFNMAEDAVLDIHTSHADIEFETWDQDQVVIEATIEIEGASDEAAKNYFEDAGFEILGNSKKVSIKTAGQKSWLVNNSFSNLQNFPIEIQVLPEMTPFVSNFDFDFDFEELQNMPVFPISSMANFDHEAFDKEGEKYLKKWQKNFEKSFNKEHAEKLEEWSKRMEKRHKKMAKRHEEHAKKRQEILERRAKLLNERNEKMAEEKEERMESYLERRSDLLERRNSKMRKDSTKIIIINGDSVNTYFNNSPSIFYSTQGDHKNYKVKKTIKVKMPKGMRIKMDVRHGEVKLAENTKNINATLSHASLWATTIAGDKTNINVSYSPVNVENWEYGQLFANYSDKIDLKKVRHLRLNANASDVIIDQLMVRAFIKNDFGKVQINTINTDFEEVDISLQNAELNCVVPKVPFSIYVNGTSSQLTTPAAITLTKTKNGNTLIHKGYNANKNSNKSIVINSKYSEVTLQ